MSAYTVSEEQMPLAAAFVAKYPTQCTRLFHRALTDLAKTLSGVSEYHGALADGILGDLAAALGEVGT